MSERVRVTEVAEAMGNYPFELAMFWVGKVGGRVQPDWRGMPSVTVETAAKAVSAAETARESQRQKEMAYQRYLVERATARQRIGAEAYQEAANSARGRGVLGPALHDTATAAQQQALAEWDRKHPETPLSKFEVR